MIEAVVFDFDGLIFDSETHGFEVAREVMAEHGVELTMEVWSGVVGTHSGAFDPVAFIESRIGAPVDREAVEEVLWQRFYARIETQDALPGVKEVLEATRALGLKVGLASNSTHEWVDGQIARLGLAHYFHCVRTADDVERPKPAPDLYLEVLRCLDVPPERAVAFEDSPTGALAAKRAGLYCVVVPNPITAALEFGEHDVRLESLLHEELSELLARIAEADRGSA